MLEYAVDYIELMRHVILSELYEDFLEEHDND